MKEHLDRPKVLRWLRGQRAANRIIEKERLAYLKSLDHESSLQTYIEMTKSRLTTPRSTKRPSFVLMAMRRALGKMRDTSK